MRALIVLLCVGYSVISGPGEHFSWDYRTARIEAPAGSGSGVLNKVRSRGIVELRPVRSAIYDASNNLKGEPLVCPNGRYIEFVGVTIYKPV